MRITSGLPGQIPARNGPGRLRPHATVKATGQTRCGELHRAALHDLLHRTPYTDDAEGIGLDGTARAAHLPDLECANVAGT